MKDKEATQLLEESLAEIDSLEESGAFSSKHTRWYDGTMFLLEEIFGMNSRIYYDFASLTWVSKGYFRLTMHPEKELEYQNNQGYLKDLETARGLIEAGIDLVRRRGVDAVFEGDILTEASGKVKIISLIEKCLRKAFRTKPKNEKEVQDKLEALFLGAGLEFTREKEGIPYSAKTYYPDFVFRRIKTVVEVKLCNSDLREKQIIGEMNNYILAFKTKYPNLIFVVYDSGGVIRDEDEFKSCFEQHESVAVIIKKH